MCLKEIGLRANHSRLNGQHNGVLHDHLMSLRIFTLIINKILMSSKIMRKMARDTIWEWQSSLTNSVFRIQREVGAELKASISGPLNIVKILSVQKFPEHPSQDCC